MYRTTGDDGFAGARAQQQRQSLSDSASFADEDIVPVIESGAPRLQMGGAETISSSSDLHDFEIQPPERRLVDWGEDLLWELLLAGGDIGKLGAFATIVQSLCY